MESIIQILEAISTPLSLMLNNGVILFIKKNELYNFILNRVEFIGIKNNS